MGRKLMRVPMDFKHPLDEIWTGYLNTLDEGHATKCTECKNGLHPEAQLLHDQWYGYVKFEPHMTGSTPVMPDDPQILDYIRLKVKRADRYYLQFGTGKTKEEILNSAIAVEAQRMCKFWNSHWSHHLDADDVKALVDEGRLWDFTRRPRNAEQVEQLEAEEKKAGRSLFWMAENNGFIPTPEEVNRWSLFGFGHDSINNWVCVKAKAQRLGLKRLCETCNGETLVWDSPESKAAYEAWKPTDPPTGEGYQLWTTTNEGAPISPVFSTLHSLCVWAAENATTFGDQQTSATSWAMMLDENNVHHREGNMIFI
jgi:hypothetical protein